MSNGRIQGCGTMGDLRGMVGSIEKYRVEVRGLEQSAALKIAEKDPKIHLAAAAEDHCCFEFDNDLADERLSNLICAVQEGHGKIRTVTCDPLSLDIVFERLATRPDKIEPTELPVQDRSNAAGAEQIPSTERQAPVLETRSPDTRWCRFRKWIVSESRTACALVKRDIIAEFSYRFSLLMQLMEIILTVAGLFFLSRLIGHDTINRYLAPYGGNYFAFAIIGVAFYNYFSIGFTRYAAQLRDAQTTGTLEAMLSTPAGLSTIVLGSSLWAFIMATLRVVLILVAGAFLLDMGIVEGNYPLAVLILLMSIASATGFGLVAASFIVVLKRGDPISWLFRSASWLLGGVIFPVTVLPLWIQKLAQLIPTTPALRAMRLALLQGKPLTGVIPEIASLSLFCLILLPISLRVLNYSVQRAKREGSLTHY
jgi:ABC-2 type transport system permease protein